MIGRLSQRLFPLLQLTRMALVFTAISNSLCTLLLWTRSKNPEGAVWEHLQARQVAAVVLVSCGLYGFGMSLNDIIDRRRDRQLAAHRPLPSGRIGVATAHAACISLIAMALIAGAAYATWSGQGMMSLVPILFLLGMIPGGFVGVWYLLKHKTSPFTSLITLSGVFITLSFVLGVMALLADMLGRHRKISEELLYLARRKIYAGKRVPRPVMASIEPAKAVARLFEESWGVDPSASHDSDVEEELTIPIPDGVRASARM